MKRYVVGLDYGSLSGRALLVDAETGETVAESVSEYRHAVMSECLPDGTRLPTDSAVQHPQDYLDVLSVVIRDVIEQTNITPEQIIGIGIDFTAATVLPVDQNLTPLCFQPRFQSHPKAYVTMWKDHTAAPQAEIIDRISERTGSKHLSYLGGKCSAENGLAKILCILQTDEEVYNAAYRILEAGDWITMLISGTDRKGYNYAACKEFWNPVLGGYPSKEFMKALDPRFESVVEDKFGGDTVSYEPCCGTITERGAKLTGLAVGTPVSIPYVDGYCSMPACGVVKPGKMSMIIGTSLCHMVSSEEYTNIPGIFAAVPDLVYKGYTTYEGGQASCGDLYAWFLENCIPAAYTEEAKDRGINLHKLMREKLMNTKPGASGLLCLDWFNGNRSVLGDPDLSGMILGLTIHTKPEEIYRALLESSVFGTRRILEQLVSGGIEINEIIACGGIAHKDEFMMQMFADVTNRPIRVCASTQAPALSSAMYAAVAAGKARGGYDSIEEAVDVMAKLLDKTYYPNPENHAIYNKLYEQYQIVHDTFGIHNKVMKRLREIRAEGV
ncbi:MAG: ribulokinase [Clostridia bacterium]|nr:ribulokinase [Clostridia bacterium]